MSILILSIVYSVAVLAFLSIIFVKAMWFLVLMSILSGLLACAVILIAENMETYTGSQPAPMTPITSTRRDNISTKIIMYLCALFAGSCIALYRIGIQETPAHISTNTPSQQEN